MIDAPKTLARRTVGEWTQRHRNAYPTPFVDMRVEARFTSPSGRVVAVPGFYDGGETWRVRFNPGEAGRWRWKITSRPHVDALAGEGTLEVSERACRGYLRATPGQAWGFTWENGEPAFLMGDTVYHLFGFAHCGGDVEGFLRRRKSQGVNLLRIRVPVSRFHHPEGYSDWQTRSCHPWGGSENRPRFDQFNLDWFATVDRVVQLCERLEIGIEMIMEGWGFEFPFNSRSIFTAEYEELWLRFLIARYDAYNCVAIWTPLNEYEYYPNGDWNYKVAADLWALRIARWMKATAGHGHIVAMHNGPRLPPFAERFRADPEAVDAIMYQDWGTRDRDQGWLAIGIEDMIAKAFEGWRGSAVFAEFGYERNPAFQLKLPSHEFCDRDHSRRGIWRGAFCALCVIHGFENSWGPWMELGQDQPGMADFVLFRKFFTERVPWQHLRPAPELLAPGDWEAGRRPLALATPARDVVAAYLPAGGSLRFADASAARTMEWFDPRSGATTPATAKAGAFTPPEAGSADRPHDWVLVTKTR